MYGHEVQKVTLVSSNLPNIDYDEYNPTTTYNKGSMCSVAADEKNYYCTADGIVGITPKDNQKIWDSEPINKKAMFDYTNSKKTVNAELIEQSFTAINIDAISLFGLVAQEVEIIMIDNDTNAEVYRDTFDLVEDELEDFGDYLFSPQELQEKFTTKVPTSTLDAIIDAMIATEQSMDRFTARPPIYYDVTITLKIKNPGSNAECAFVGVGRQRDLGYTVKDGLYIDKSFIGLEERDNFGNIKFDKLISFNTINADVWSDMPFDILESKLRKIEGEPFVFIPVESDSINATNTLAIYQSLEMKVDPDNPSYSIELASLLRNYK